VWVPNLLRRAGRREKDSVEAGPCLEQIGFCRRTAAQKRVLRAGERRRSLCVAPQRYDRTPILVAAPASANGVCQTREWVLRHMRPSLRPAGLPSRQRSPHRVLHVRRAGVRGGCSHRRGR
jgi:hypothetical protein